MRQWIVLFALLLIGGSVAAQGSPGVVAPVYTKTGDTLVILASSGDSVMMYDSSSATVVRLRGTNTYWVFPGDTLLSTILKATDRVVSPIIQVGKDGGAGAIVFDNFALSATIYSLTGDGLEIVNGYLAATLGATVEGSEITNQTIGKSDIDTTIANMVYAAIFKKTSAVADSAYQTKYYIDNNLFGYSVVGTPAGGQVPVFNSGTSSWSFGSGGSGSGDDIAFDMTGDNSNYVLGATTYTGGYINTSTVWMRGDGNIDILKSGQHPGDTMILTVNTDSLQKNDSTNNVRVFQNDAGEHMMIMEDSSSYTKIGTGNASGFKFNGDVNVDSKIRFFGSNREIDSIYAMKGAPNSLQFKIFDSDTLGLQTLGSDAPVVIGSSVNWTFDADTLRGANGQILGIKYAYVDTLSVLRALMRAGQFGIVTSTDTALLFTRDSTNDTTTVRAVGKLKFTADAGLTEFDSAAYHGRIRMYDGTNKSRIDSASQVLADTIKTLPGGYLAMQGATSGRTRIRGNASAITSYDLTLPAAQGSASQTLVNDGSGNLAWSSAGGGGNGSADFDSTTGGGLDSNILKGSSGTILLDVHKNATPSVVIGKGATMTSLILGGNNSALSSVDTSLLINGSLYFANGAGDYDRLDSSRVVNMIRLHRYYFDPDDFYGSPEAYVARHVLTSWNEADTSSFPNNIYKRNALFYAKDTNGSNTLPYNFTYVAQQRDSLFSTVYNILTGFTQPDSSSLYAAALYVNETKVDTLNPQKAVTSFTVDSLNWTDRAIAQGDVVTVLLYLKLNPVGTSKKRVDIKDMYLNMRRY